MESVICMLYFRSKWSAFLGFSFWPLGVFLWFSPPTSTFAEGDLTQSLTNPGYSGAELAWREVASSSVQPVLEMILSQVRGNYGRIQTWTGSYAVQSQRYFSPDRVNATFAGRIPDHVSALIMDMAYSQQFAIDIESAKIFRSKDTSQLKWISASSHSTVKIPGVDAIEDNSIVTNDSYLHFSPKSSASNYTVLPDHPDAQHKRAAYRLAPEKARGQHYGDLMDPRAFYSVSGGKMFWEELGDYARAVQETSTGPLSKELGERIKVYEAESEHALSYGMVVRLEDRRQGGDVFMSSVWQEASGFNPVSFRIAADAVGKATRSLTGWRWRKVGDIFVPSEVSSTMYDEATGRVDYHRVARQEDVQINRPLDPHQFDYQALGLEEGELVLDKVSREVFAIRNGEAIKLGNFGDSYRRSSAGRVTMAVVGVLGFLCLAVIVLSLRRRQKESRG